MENVHSLQTLPYPQGLEWPLQASAIAALHPQLVQAPFAEPIFYTVTGLEPSDEERYRSWARPVRKKQTIIALALTASVHACLGRGELTLRVPTGQRPLTSDQIRLVAASNTNEAAGAVERQLLELVRASTPASLSDTLRALLGSATGADQWLAKSGLTRATASEGTLLQALALASSLVTVYMQGLDYALPAEPDTTLGGVLEIVDEAIVKATSRLAG